MTGSDAVRIAGYYDALVDRYGYGPRAVDASSARSLEVRYAALAAAAPLAGKRVLEVGCGFGDLGAYIAARFDGVRYTGIDLSARMIEVGRRKHSELELLQADVLELEDSEQFDVVLAQGIFYLLGDGAEAKMHALITKMFGIAREAVACSAISAWGPHQDPAEFRVEPARLIDFASSLTTSLVFRHDYHSGDLALYLYKQLPREPRNLL